MDAEDSLLQSIWRSELDVCSLREVLSSLSGFLLKLSDTALLFRPELIRFYQNPIMATFTSVPQNTSSEFRHYDPTLLKRTQSKPKAKKTEKNGCRNDGEVAIQSLGLLLQGNACSLVT